MARNWLWQTGWETGWLGRGPAPGLAQRIVFIDQDLWGAGGVAGANPVSPGRGGFGYCMEALPLGAGVGVSFSGNWIARTQRYIYWVTFVNLLNWGTPANLAAADDYVHARCCNLRSTGAAQYLGIGWRVLAIPPNPLTVQYAAHLFNANGTLNTGGVIVGGAAYTVGASGWAMVVLGMDTTTRACRLLYNNVPIGAAYTAPAGIYMDAPMLRDSAFTGGKGSDAGMTMHYDDWGSCETAVAPAGDDPPTSLGVRLYQPNGDVAVAWNPVPPPFHAYNWADENRASPCPGVPACNYNNPVGVGLREGVAMADEGGGVIEGVRMVWDNAYYSPLAPHTLQGRINPAVPWVPTPGAPGSGQTSVLACDPYTGNVRWHGQQMPNPAGGAWNTADLNNLEAALVSVDTTAVGEFYAMAMGRNLTAPTQTPCPPLPLYNAARQFGGEQPYPAKPKVVSYHHH